MLTKATGQNMLDDTTITALNHFKARIVNQYGEAEFILFGSRARGDHRPDSDADVAVLLAGEPLPPYKTKMDMAKIAFDVLLDDDLLISPLPLWRQEWENPDQYNNPFLIFNIKREGVAF